MWPFRKLTRPFEKNNGEKMRQPTNLRLSQHDRIRNLIRHEMFRQQLGKEEAESFEEADDFDLPENEEWVSPYEEQFDPNFDHPPGKPVSPEPEKATPASPEPDKSSEA